MRGSFAALALAACAHAPPPSHGRVTFERHPVYVALIPFGAGQVQNGERGKGVAFAAAEGATAAISAGVWMYLEERYPTGRVPAAEATRVRALEQIEIGTGVAFLGLAAWGVADALAHHEPWIEVPLGDAALAPAIVPGGAGLALTWSR